MRYALAFVSLVFLVIVVALILSPLIFGMMIMLSSDAEAAFTQRATHPGSPNIEHIQGYQGGVYVGYAGGNSTPIYRFNPSSNSYTLETTLMSDAVQRIRVADNQLFVLGRNPVPAATGDAYAVNDGAWSSVSTATIETDNTKHPVRYRDLIYQTQTVTLAADANRVQGTIYVSAGANLWSVFDRSSNNQRWCFLGLQQTQYYYQDANSACAKSANFARTEFFGVPITGPSIVVGSSVVTKADEFAGQLLTAQDGRLYRRISNNLGSTPARSELIWDYTIYRDSVIVLQRNGQVCSTQTFRSWNCFDQAPPNARVITTTARSIFVGTTNGRIHQAPNPLTPARSKVNMAPIITLLLE